MKTKIFFSCILVFSLVLSAFAADVAGKWTGKIMDQFDVTYEFKMEADKLVGSTLAPDGGVIPLKNLKVEGEDISFSLDVMGNNIDVKGKVVGNSMKLSFSYDGNPVEFELKKAI